MKFKIIETGLDTNYDVTVNGYFVENGVQVGTMRTFVFDPTEVSLAKMQDEVSKAQPNPADIAEANAKKTAAETALAQLNAYVGTEVALDPYTE